MELGTLKKRGIHPSIHPSIHGLVSVCGRGGATPTLGGGEGGASRARPNRQVRDKATRHTAVHRHQEECERTQPACLLPRSLPEDASVPALLFV